MGDVLIHKQTCPQRKGAKTEGKWVSSELDEIITRLGVVTDYDFWGAELVGGAAEILYTAKHHVEHSGRDPWDCVCEDAEEV